jgi:hypothetical protein
MMISNRLDFHFLIFSFDVLAYGEVSMIVFHSFTWCPPFLLPKTSDASARIIGTIVPFPGIGPHQNLNVPWSCIDLKRHHMDNHCFYCNRKIHFEWPCSNAILNYRYIMVRGSQWGTLLLFGSYTKTTVRFRDLLETRSAWIDSRTVGRDGGGTAAKNGPWPASRRRNDEMERLCPGGYWYGVSINGGSPR